MHTCPVCGFKELEFPPTNYNICPSCGTEFGVDDVGVTHADLRAAWKAAGTQWWSTFEDAPLNWNPIRQLEDLFPARRKVEVYSVSVEQSVTIPGHAIFYPLEKKQRTSGAYALRQYSEAPHIFTGLHRRFTKIAHA